MQRIIALSREKHQAILQPRMGFADINKMEEGLRTVKNVNDLTLGTITLDSFTRQNNFIQAQQALDSKLPLNGFPLLNYPSEQIISMCSELESDDFIIQVRHGTSKPEILFHKMSKMGLVITEGGPISYCLPYSQTPLIEALASWNKACEHLANNPLNKPAHIESFSGCILGQMTPPSILIALNILEGLFFKANGIGSISLSYAQGTNLQQDLAAISVLKNLAENYFKDIDWHCVLYTFMGMFPLTPQGAKCLIRDSALLASQASCDRLIIKTIVEATRLPSIKENIEAINLASTALKFKKIIEWDQEEFEEILNEATSLIEAVLSLDKDLSKALIKAFQKGVLAIPYCLHPENDRKVTAIIDNSGYLRWRNINKLAISSPYGISKEDAEPSAQELFDGLKYMQVKYDTMANNDIERV